MNTLRAHIVLPQELVAEIDSVVGPRGRSAFLVETARAELRRRRLLAFLQSSEPILVDKNHPELAGGSSAWVRKLRADGEKRIPKTNPRKRPRN